MPRFFVSHQSMQKRFILGLAVSAIFIYLAFRQIDFAQMWVALQQANYLWLFPAVGFMFISMWLRAMRWGYFMEPIKPGIGFRKLFSAMMIGYYGNNVFPLRAGEVLRAYAIGKSAGVSRMASFATIFVERLIDVLALLVLIGFSVFFHDYPGWIEKGSILIFVFTVLVTLFMTALMLRTQQTLHFVSRLTHPFPEKIQQFVNQLLGSFLEGFSIFKKTDRFGSIIWQSVAIWLLYAAVNYAVLEAFGLNEQLPIGASFVILVVVNISIMIPAAPGYVGTFHLACQQAAMLFGVSTSTALSFALILHISNFIPITLVGFYYFSRAQLDFKRAVAGEDGAPAPKTSRSTPRQKIGV